MSSGFVISDEKFGVNIMENPLYMNCFSLAFKIFSLTLELTVGYNNLTADLFKLILLGVYSASQLCRFISFIKSVKFGAIISSVIYLASFSLSSPSGIAIMCILVHWKGCWTSLFFFILFPSLLTEWFQLSYLQVFQLFFCLFKSLIGSLQ